MTALLLLLCSCEQQKPEKIQWQLPLEAPADPHSSAQNAELPQWATACHGEAALVLLQKSSARTETVKLALGSETTVNGWNIRLLGFASGLRIKNSAFLDDKNVDNPAAFVEISRDGEIRYRGWLYKKFPELFGMDDPEWKVWLKDIILRPAS